MHIHTALYYMCVGCERTGVYVIRLSQGLVPLGNWHTALAILYYSRSTEKNSKPCDSLQSGTIRVDSIYFNLLLILFHGRVGVDVLF